ncbi:MAG: ATP-binding protein [Pseudomonadota bacterium]
MADTEKLKDDLPRGNRFHSEPRGCRCFGIREKLITIFIVIKVLPLIALALFAARQIALLGNTVKDKSEQMVGDTQELVTGIGALASENSIRALDLKARESIERLTTDTALSVSRFLHERDRDILLAAQLGASESIYQQFLAVRHKEVVYHQAWHLSEDGSRWLPPPAEKAATGLGVEPSVPDNNKDFHYLPPQNFTEKKMQPLYHEMTFVGLDGREIIKVSATDLLGSEKKDVSRKENTWCAAETYFADLVKLQQGEIYVSKVIGPYMPSNIIGPYTPERAKKSNTMFAPEQAAYAGKENPVGKRFQGVIRWASPVFQDGRKIGYVTLALDHTHIMEFTDHIVPTDERYSDISDAGSGNYAFMWDYAGRNISHPRDYFIVGYNPETGEQTVPWLSAELYDLWQSVGQSFTKFEQVAPRFLEQSLAKTAAKPLTEAGFLGLDCRYLNFAPQCSGWHNLTQYGGSGSFVIFWSNLWKLTTAATIPYSTGMYKYNPRGFGYVTVGANVDEFHSSATETAARINSATQEYESNLDKQEKVTLELLDRLLATTFENLTVSTGIMVALVIIIAIWMAAILTGKITAIIAGIKLFQSGQFQSRLKVERSDELGQLAGAFNEMADYVQESMDKISEAKDRAEGSDRAKSLFLANMSHEIRTPMNAIIGMSRLALEASENDEQRKLLDSVKTSADSLLAVVNDILDFSKIEAGQLDLETYPFSVPALVQSLVKSISVLAGPKDINVGHSIAESVPEIVLGDQMRLRQILLNLLGNAVKFTKQGTVDLEVRNVGSEAGRIELSFTVRDTGIGIPTEHLEMIFDRFSQSDLSISRKHQGTGLGLAISRKLCRMMGGDITVESEVGKGSTFTFKVLFDIPDDSEPVGGESQRSGQDVEIGSLHILLVEDNETNRVLARMVLENENHRVAVAESGIEALEKLAAENFDAVLMDIQMPGMDGFTATQIIRRCESGQPPACKIAEDIERPLRKRLYGRHQLIVALTAHAMSGDKERCIATGMDDYLTKPFFPEQVTAVLRRSMDIRGRGPQ